VAGLPVWASKPGAGEFTGLDLKTGGASGAARRWRRRTRGIFANLASRRSEVVKAACPSDGPVKTWTILPLRGIWVVCLMEDILIIGQGVCI